LRAAEDALRSSGEEFPVRFLPSADKDFNQLLFCLTLTQICELLQGLRREARTILLQLLNK